MTKNKLLLLLVLLMTAATGAWAQEETLLTTITATDKDSYDETTAGVVTVTHDNSDIYGEYGWVWWANPGSITVEAKEGYTITRCVFRQATKNPITVSTAPFKVNFVETANPSHPNQKKFLCQGDWNLNMNGVTSIEVYGNAAPPTYSITLAEGTEDSDKWTIEPKTGLKGGETVTATYSGEKKVKSVKAVKKAAAPAYPLLSAATTSDIGKVVCAAGHLHDAKTAVPAGCTAVGILGKVTETGHGLILALEDATQSTGAKIDNVWTSVDSYAGTTLKIVPELGTDLTSYTTLGETAVSNWAVAQKSDYEAIFTNLGSTKSDDNGTTYDDNVNAYITTGVGGAAITSLNWSASIDGNKGWAFHSNQWYTYGIPTQTHIRPVLGF